MKSANKKPVKKKSSKARSSKWKTLAIYFGIPFLFYFLFFWLYAGTWMGHFSTRFFTDQGDGFQNVWNMWWVNFSVTHLHQLPWHTNYLHYPYGTTLLGQTLNPFNGFVAIALLKVFSLVQAFNIMVIFSFVFGGVTTFWLCHFFTKKYIPSLIGGFIFTFSSYHFAHAIGHMQLVSIEWIPLFILLWWKLITKPRYLTAIGASLTLLLVLFCDYYYFLYSVGIAILILLYLWFRKEFAPINRKENYLPYLVFIVLSVLIVAPLPIQLFIYNARDPLLGSHPVTLFSADPINILLDGEYWRFGWITHFYWKHVPAYWAESSIYLSFSVLFTLVIAFWKRTKIHKDIGIWLIIGVIFGLFSLGSRLTVAGHTFHYIILPYAVLERIIPDLKLSGVPDRMISITILSSAVIASMVLSKLDLKARKGQILTAIFFVVLAFELWPNILPYNVANAYPAYVNALHKLPAGGVLDDGASTTSWQLYDQTIFEKPMALGYISRVPTSVNAKDAIFVATVSAGDYSKLCSVYKIRYLTQPASRPLNITFPIIYRDSQSLIYDLKDSPNC